MNWRVKRVPTTGSTNVDVVAAAQSGEPEGYVLVADEQTTGKGRLGRSWSSQVGASLSVSMLLRPTEVPAARWPWLPLLVGVVAAEAVRDVAGVTVALKWPNDVLIEEAKLAGILVERAETPTGPVAVAGIGMNLTAGPPGAAVLQDYAGTAQAGVPEPPAAASPARDPGGAAASALKDGVLDALLDRLASWYRVWRADPGAQSLPNAYRAWCGTLGQDVLAQLPGGGELTGRAMDVDESGRLVIATSTGRESVGAGDIIHLRGL